MYAMNAVSTPTVISPWLTCQMPKAHTMSRPMSVSSVTVGENRLQVRLRRSFTARFARFASRKRCDSRFSCANAFTTRMPGIVSASTFVTSLHARPIFSKPMRRRLRTAWIIQPITGSGTSVTSASHGLIEKRIAEVMTSITTSVMKSSACSDRKIEMRSVSEPMRAIRSPVRLAPK